ncbi:hypothetical protein, partial [Enterococcus faecium]|uniref:hypothetical protein n=1 Tax=Enterococcus faecium TaxID=1352 RepID=UPI00292EB75C
MQPNLRTQPFVIDPFAIKNVDALIVTHIHSDHLDIVLKTKFEKEYGISAEETYKVASQFVADASDAIRKFGISILND